MKIALFGTFDVDNYGDLLFPYIAQNRYPEHQWTFVSPTNGKTSFRDSKIVISIQEAQNKNFDLVIIGGGNIIHTKTTSLANYKKQKVEKLAYPELWIGAAKLAQRQGIPYVFNTPSISYLHATKLERFLFRKVLNKSSYLSFREEYSCDFAQHYTTKTINCVPDTAIEICKVWPYEKQIKKNKIVFNLNQRYHKPINITAFFMDTIAEKLQCEIEVVVIGDCHGDIEFSKKVVKQLKTKNVNLIEKQSLKELAHRIAEASYFIGSSMHGFITALSYRTPALLVLNEHPMHKFKGLVKILGLRKNTICSDWKEAIDRIEEPAILSKNEEKEITEKLDSHWNSLLNIDLSKQRRRSFNLLLFWKTILNFDRKINKLRILKNQIING